MIVLLNIFFLYLVTHYFGVLFFSLGILPLGVAGACLVTMDLIVRVHVRTRTTTRSTTPITATAAATALPLRAINAPSQTQKQRRTPPVTARNDL